MAIALVQSKSANSAGSSVTSQAITWDSNTTTGNLVVVCICYYETGSDSVSSITDSQTNTYSLAKKTAKSSHMVVEIWYAKNITGGTTPTVTATFTNTSSGIRDITFIREYSGCSTTAPLDIVDEASITSTASPWSMTSASSTNFDNEVVIIAGSFNNNSKTYSASSGYGNLQQATGGSIHQGAAEDKVISSTGTQTGGFSFTPTTSMSGILGMATFTDGVAASTPAISVSDSISITESANVANSNADLNVSELVTVNESVVAQIESAPTISINTSDQITVTENVSVTLLYRFINVSDSITVTQYSNVYLLVPLNINIFDSVNITESTSVAVVYVPLTATAGKDSLEQITAVPGTAASATTDSL